MRLEGIDMMELTFNKKNDSFYMPVIVQHPVSDHRTDTYARVDNIEHIVTCYAGSEFDICVPSSEVTIKSEESGYVIGTPLRNRNVSKTSYKTMSSGAFKNSVEHAITLLDDKMREDLIEVNEDDTNIIEEYTYGGYILGYYLDSNDKSKIKVMIPNKFSKKKNHLVSKSKILVPVEIYAIPVIDEKFFSTNKGG